MKKIGDTSVMATLLEVGPEKEHGARDINKCIDKCNKIESMDLKVIKITIHWSRLHPLTSMLSNNMLSADWLASRHDSWKLETFIPFFYCQQYTLIT